MLLTIQRQQTHSSLHIQGSSSLSFAFLEFTSPCFMMANMTPSIRIIAGARTKSALVPRVSASSRTMIVNSLLRRILSNRSTITPSIPVRLAFQTSVQRRSLATQVNGPLYTSQTQMVSYNTSQSRMRKSSRLHFKTNANYFQFSDTTLFTATSRGETMSKISGYRQCLLDHGVQRFNVNSKVVSRRSRPYFSILSTPWATRTPTALHKVRLISYLVTQNPDTEKLIVRGFMGHQKQASGSSVASCSRPECCRHIAYSRRV